MFKLSALLIALFCLIGVAFSAISLNDPELIHTINSHPTGAWKATAYAKFEGKTLSDVDHMFGAYLTNSVRPSMYAVAPPTNQRSLIQLPDSFNARDKWSKCVHPIRDQESCSSCWAFSSSEMLSDRFCIASNGTINTVLSPQFMVSCDKFDGGCKGGNMDSLWKFLTTTGTVEDSCWPYVSGDGDVPSCRKTCVNGEAMKFYKAKSVKNFHPNDIESMQHEIMTNGPIMSGFMVYQDFVQYTSGVYHHISGAFMSGHAIKIVGWGVDSQSKLPYWIVANSWGVDWGMNGFFWIKRGSNECEIEEYMYTANAQL